jgi:hypothetical protein
MSLTPEERALMEKFETELTRDERAVVEDTISDFRASMRDCGLTPANDDRAACLEAALVRYILESRRGHT